MMRDDRRDEILSGGVWGANPVLRRYLGRPRSEAVVAASRAALVAATCMTFGVGMFAVAALGVVPSFGPWENIGLVLLSMLFFIVGLMAASWWSHLDRALHDESTQDPEWDMPGRRSLLLRYAVPIAGGSLAGVVVRLAREWNPDNPVPALLTLAAILIGALILLVLRDYRTRRSRRQ